MKMDLTRINTAENAREIEFSKISFHAQTSLPANICGLQQLKKCGSRNNALSRTKPTCLPQDSHTPFRAISLATNWKQHSHSAKPL